MTKQMWVHPLGDAGPTAILLHDLLDAPRRKRAAALCLEQVAVARIRPKVALEDQPKRGWEQNVAVLGSFAVVNEDLRLAQVDIAGLDAHQLAHPYRRVEQQLQ